ncbi:hypothetical protein P3T76_004169 [Phytophthora citrophthora]|uniref:Uncharacterized protein n=1 Tax=Phytophthora citrophthora TaxID=4793 RepID=A0AAD9LR41_9STRA|nr:hypothetical protein P3T76_004169 [Phytophthora citrophthora]
METVALEWIGLQAVESRDVVQFVQQLKNVPEDAMCEVGDIFSRKCNSQSARQEERMIRNEVHLSCEPRVAEFLCKKFSKQIQHITSGEVIRVRCKRVYPGVKPLGEILSRKDTNPIEPYKSTEQMDIDTFAAPVLPVEKVIALIDLLGDQVVEAQEAYQLFAANDTQGLQRMTLFGLAKALTKLCKNEWTAKSSKKGACSKITVESLRYLLSKLVASNNIAVKQIPSSTTTPFLSYTDFLACYVAFLSSLHSST